MHWFERVVVRRHLVRALEIDWARRSLNARIVAADLVEHGHVVLRTSDSGAFSVLHQLLDATRERPDIFLALRSSCLGKLRLLSILLHAWVMLTLKPLAVPSVRVMGKLVPFLSNHLT